MFKGARETKGSTVAEEFTAMSGKRFRRADVENPSRPGYLRDELVPILPDVWSAGSYFDLFTPTGRRMRPLESKPDPSVVRPEDVPEPLRRAMAEAEKRLAEAYAKVTAALDARAAAEAELIAAGRTEDTRRHNRAVVAAQEAEQRRLDAELALPPLRAEVGRVSEKVRAWIWDEHLVRQGR